LIGRAVELKSCFMDTQSTFTLLPETLDRMCPYCRTRFVAALGHVTASAAWIRCDYRCLECSQDFVLLR
jgi:DNA-directed RNA polymerase subunit RPC12/RpoP